MSPVLIPDLYDQIAQVLGRPVDHATLLSLSLTSRSLRVICLKELFSSVVLLPRVCDEEGVKGYSSDDDNATSRFETKLKNMTLLVESNPCIFQYVRALHFQSHPSNFDDIGLLRLLDGFTNVSTFSMSTFYVPRKGIIWGTAPSIKPFRIFAQEWDELPEPLQCALQKIIGSPTIKDVDIRYFQNIPVAFFQSCREVQSLRLLYSSVAESHQSIPTCVGANNVSIKLGSLDFGRGPKSIAPLLYAQRRDGLPVVDASALTSLSVHLNGNMEDMHDFLYNLRGIKHLFIDLQEYYHSNVPYLFGGIHPDFLSTLQTLRLALVWRSPMSNEGRILPTDILGALSGLRILSRLAVSITVYTTSHITDLMDNMEKLDEILANNSQFSTLQGVLVGISFAVYMASRNILIDRRKWQSLTSTHFVRLAAKPSISLDVTVKIM